MPNGPLPKGLYKRLFPEARKPIPTADEPHLEALGAAMTDNNESHDSLLTAGYTYFGQFIDHDLTWNRALIDAPPDVQATAPNFRTAKLDLDHVYGGGPAISPSLYEGTQGAERFRIGRTLPNPLLNLPGGTARDLPFDDGIVQIGDQADFRDTENLIVRQLHLVLMKFHNVAIGQLQQNQVRGDLPGGSTTFERARKLITWNYQYLVWNDFLLNVLHSEIWGSPHQLSQSQPASEFQLPLEFALAAFRFGHSMVRDIYPLNCHRPHEPLLALINSKQTSADRLREDDLVEWSRFFSGVRRSRAVTHARAIDVHIGATLHALPVENGGLFTSSVQDLSVIDLPARTLLRGVRARLASGQEVAEAMRETGVIAAEFDRDASNPGQTLKKIGLTDNTPLWYYILKEAELQQHGHHLGRIGSRIVRDAIEGALQNDTNSYLFVTGPSWQPPEWLFPDSQRRTVRWISSLISLVGDSELPQGCEATKFSELMENSPRVTRALDRTRNWFLTPWN